MHEEKIEIGYEVSSKEYYILKWKGTNFSLVSISYPVLDVCLNAS